MNDEVERGEVAGKVHMIYRCMVATALAVVFAHPPLFGAQGARALPNRDGRPVVAVVNGDVISLDELVLQLGASADRSRLRQGRATTQELEILERLVTIKLVGQEAVLMGIAELPEIRKQVEVTSREILRELLIERLVKDVKPDAAAVEKRFRESVREWRTASLLFQDEAAARRARAEIEGGAVFDEVAGRTVAAKLARRDGDERYHAKKDYLPQIAQAIAPLRVGQVGPVIRLQAGYVIVKVVDIRYPEDPAARAEARQQVLREEQAAALQAHERASRRRYVLLNKPLLDQLDYTTAKPGFDALLKDTRVVANIMGAAPVTVGDLTDYLRMQFFHGGNPAKQASEMNSKKHAALDATVGRRVLNMEALRLGIDKTSAYRDRVKGYRESLVFDSFVQKVIAPGSKMTEEEVRQHYRGHPREYAYPEMVKLRSLAFTGRGAAEAAMRKLREGADFGWIAANAEEQADRNAQGLVAFDGRPVTTDSMPKDVQKALARPRAGEYRLYAGPDGRFYVLAIQQVIDPQPKPYADVREDIARKLYADKLKAAIEEHAGKLRARAKVETYLKRVS